MFDSVFIFAQKASPMAILMIAVLIIGFILYQLFVGKMTLKISQTQDEKYPEIKDRETNHYENVKKLIEQNNTLLNNHFKHEIPEILEGQKTNKEIIERVEETVNEIRQDVKSHSDRLIKVETLIEIIREKKK